MNKPKERYWEYDNEEKKYDEYVRDTENKNKVKK